MEGRKFSFDGIIRQGLSYLPVAAGITIILIFGTFAELQTRALTHQAERARVGTDLESVRASLELAVGAQFEVLARISGAITAAPTLQRPQFMSVVTSTVPDISPIAGIAAVSPNTDVPLVTGAFMQSDALKKWLSDVSVETPGARNFVTSGRPNLLIWIPVYVGDTTSTRRQWGFVTAVIDTEAIFAVAGLRDQSRDLNIALTTGDGITPGRSRSLQLGHSSILNSDPVTVDVAISGGDWALSAIPREGWSQNSAAIWPIRILTILSILLVAGPMIRTRRLVCDRQRHITVLNEREKQLAETSDRLRLALEVSEMAVWEYDVENDTAIWDAPMYHLFDLPDGTEPTHSVWRSCLHPDDVAPAEKHFSNCIETGERYQTNFRIVLKDGTCRHLRAFGALKLDSNGAKRIVGVNWDVTADVLRNAQLELRQKEAEEASAAKSRFVATISHEIRTPMNGVIGILNLMLRDDLSDVQRERGNIVRDSSRHLLAIVNDLLDLSKLRSERVDIHPEPTNVSRISQDVIALMSSISSEKDVHLITRNAGYVPQNIMCDPLRLRQVIMNLAGNAVKYTDVGSIEMSLAYDTNNQVLTVEVQDTGIGIPAEKIDQLFDRYVQADAMEAQRRGGTGLGLAICRDLVTLMGGGISVESTVGKGSSFRFWIPAPPAPTDRPDETDTSRASIKVSNEKTAIRILVAEDNAVNQRVLSGYLDIGGHDVTIVSNGLDAIDAARTGKYDLILMDVEMPVIDGVTAARRIRALGGTVSRIPIIAVTANSGDEATSTYLEAGMNAHILKPISVDNLFDEIEKAMGIGAETVETRRKPRAANSRKP